MGQRFIFIYKFIELTYWEFYNKVEMIYLVDNKAGKEMNFLAGYIKLRNKNNTKHNDLNLEVGSVILCFSNLYLLIGKTSL